MEVAGGKQLKQRNYPNGTLATSESGSLYGQPARTTELEELSMEDGRELPVARVHWQLISGYHPESEATGSGKFKLKRTEPLPV